MCTICLKRDFSRLFGIDVLWRHRWITSGMGLSHPPGWDNISPDVKIGGYSCLKSEKFSTSPLKPLNEIQRNLTGIKISTSSIKSVFFRPNWKIRWPPWPLIGLDIIDFSSEMAQRNSTKLDRKQDLNVLYQVCVFRLNRKNKMAALASDWQSDKSRSRVIRWHKSKSRHCVAPDRDLSLWIWH